VLGVRLSPDEILLANVCRWPVPGVPVNRRAQPGNGLAKVLHVARSLVVRIAVRTTQKITRLLPKPRHHLGIVRPVRMIKVPVGMDGVFHAQAGGLVQISGGQQHRLPGGQIRL